MPVTEEGTEVGQLAESMNTLLAAVETQFAARLESEQRMRQFLADASHELRTPLTSIRGYAELARMQRAAGSPHADDNLDRIESEGTRMSRLVEDLLMLARGDAAGRRAPATRATSRRRAGAARRRGQRLARGVPGPADRAATSRRCRPSSATATSCCG